MNTEALFRYLWQKIPQLQNTIHVSQIFTGMASNKICPYAIIQDLKITAENYTNGGNLYKSTKIKITFYAHDRQKLDDLTQQLETYLFHQTHFTKIENHELSTILYPKYYVISCLRHDQWIMETQVICCIHA
ncbi:MAG: hypothetical protein Q4C96_00180 [Planctomycetia bacterium]|nr:hypothetical protein [Planctomycetia bacterium]